MISKVPKTKTFFILSIYQDLTNFAIGAKFISWFLAQSQQGEATMNGQLTQRAVQAAYRKTRRGALVVAADYLKVKEIELARWIAEAIRYETFRYRREYGKCPDYRLILKMVLGSAGPRAERWRRELIDKHLIMVPSMAERGSWGGQAVHQKPHGWPKGKGRPYKAKSRQRSDKGGTHRSSQKEAKRPVVCEAPSVQQLKIVLKIIPSAGTLISSRQHGRTIEDICFELGILDNPDAWQTLLRFHDLTNNPLFQEPVCP